MIRRPLLMFALAALTCNTAVAQQISTTASPPQRTANNGNVVLSGIPEVPDSIARKVERYSNVRSASFEDWTADGAGIYITTRFGSVPQLHRVEMPGGARRQLTFFSEPVADATRRPGGSELLFSMDVGGGEFYQLFLLDPQSGEARRLTDGRSRNQGAEWSRDGQRIAFTSTRRDAQSNDVWVMEAGDTASARMVLQAPPGGASWGASDWSPNGDQLLIEEYISANDSRLHLLDLGTGQRRQIAGDARRPASYTGIEPAFAPDGRGVFLATDARGEFNQLAYLDLGSGRLEILTPEIPWDVETFQLAPDGRRAAFTINEGGISRLYLMDPATRRYAPVPAVPTGIISGLRFSPDGRRLGFSLSSADTPSDAFSLALGDAPTEAGTLTRWTFSETGGLDPQNFVMPELVQYRTFDGRQIPAFVYKPKGPGPHPVVVLIHGGPESQYRPGFSSNIQMWVNELGAAVIAPNVRGSAGYGKSYLRLDNATLRENSVKDIGALLDWAATQPELDESRVAVYGGSYGGYMVLASLMHYSPRLRAGVDVVGISDFITFLQNTQSYRRDLRRAEYGDERDPRIRAFFERIAPARHAHRITTPLLVIQGQNDPRVPVSEAEQIVRVVRENNRPVWYMNALNEGHGYRRKENQELLSQVVVLFLREHLLPVQQRTPN
jgi:dipeptidyl aminopeptidase/acylaminoacyl peptidase